MISNWNTTRYDGRGDAWYFAYKGGSFVRIKPWGTPDWTNQIQIDYYGLGPEDVTKEWLTERAAEWIADRDKDVAAGNL